MPARRRAAHTTPQERNPINLIRRHPKTEKKEARPVVAALCQHAAAQKDPRVYIGGNAKRYMQLVTSASALLVRHMPAPRKKTERRHYIFKKSDADTRSSL